MGSKPRYIAKRNQRNVVLFNEVLDCLREQIRARIRNGQLTERALARRVGLSQTHIHHVLKGARLLRMEVADALLGEMGLSLVDLVEAVQRRSTSRKDAGLAEVNKQARNELQRSG